MTRNSSDRSMPPEELAALARDVFGADRVQVAARMDDAIETAVTLADEAPETDLPAPAACSSPARSSRRATPGSCCADAGTGEAPKPAAGRQGGR